MVSSLNLRKMQFFDDSKVIIDWVNGKSKLHVVNLNTRKQQICSFLGEIEWFSCSHVFRELNSATEQAIKRGSDLDGWSIHFSRSL
jgi:hypothetical protein